MCPRAAVGKKPDPDPEPALPAVPAATRGGFQVAFSLVERKPLGQIFGGTNSSVSLLIPCNELYRQWGRESGSLRKGWFRASVDIFPEETSNLPRHHLMGWVGRTDCDKVKQHAEGRKRTEHTDLHKTHDCSPSTPRPSSL